MNRHIREWKVIVRVLWRNMPTSEPNRFQEIKRLFAAQRKYKTLAGFAQAKLMENLHFPDEE